MERSLHIFCCNHSVFPVCTDALSYFRRRTLQEAIKGKVVTTRPYLFRKIGIIMQLVVSLAFIFCAVVMMKQLYFLKNTDLGMERHNVGNVALWNGDIKQWRGR